MATDTEADPGTPALALVRRYYEACNDGGDLSDVPLAENVKFSGPLGEVEGAAEFRAHTAARGEMRCTIREQFVNGNRVCSIVDWTMPPPISSLTTTEILELSDGEIVRGEVIFDPERIRNAMSTRPRESKFGGRPARLSIRSRTR